MLCNYKSIMLCKYKYIVLINKLNGLLSINYGLPLSHRLINLSCYLIHLAIMLVWNTAVSPREYLYRRVEVLL